MIRLIWGNEVNNLFLFLFHFLTIYFSHSFTKNERETNQVTKSTVGTRFVAYFVSPSIEHKNRDINWSDQIKKHRRIS